MKITKLNMKIRSKIIIVFTVIILLMGIINVYTLLNSLEYSKKYNNIVSNITVANGIYGVFKTEIDSEMWDIVAGKTEFHKGNQYNTLSNTVDTIKGIMKNVRTTENRTRLDIVLRTIQTLTRYIDQIGIQIKDNKPVDENEKVLEDVRTVSALVEDNIQIFILSELQSSGVINRQIQGNINQWVFINVLVLGLILIFSFVAIWLISESITKPIHELNKMTKKIAEGNLDVRVENNNVPELTSLVNSFNTMTRKIKELLAHSKLEQENLKKAELKVMQAQINPHFLYNTLDTIVWLAETNKSEQVIEIVSALSNFFRVTLSKGNDMITIRSEVSHIQSYLRIQKIRYRNILDFEFDISQKIYDYMVLKLTLQPIVENALYHGIKNKREGGKILVRGYINEENGITFDVIDNGIGITEDRLKQVVSEFEDNLNEEIKDHGFGLKNVYQRIKLYYGGQYGLTIHSEYDKGTIVSIHIPMMR